MLAVGGVIVVDLPSDCLRNASIISYNSLISFPVISKLASCLNFRCIRRTNLPFSDLAFKSLAIHSSARRVLDSGLPFASRMYSLPLGVFCNQSCISVSYLEATLFKNLSTSSVFKPSAVKAARKAPCT